MTKRNACSLLLVLSPLVALAACSGGGGGGGGDATGARAEPMQFAASEPGFLRIGRAGMALEVGASESLAVELFDSLGFQISSSAIDEWTSENASVLDVQWH